MKIFISYNYSCQAFPSASCLPIAHLSQFLACFCFYMTFFLTHCACLGCHLGHSLNFMAFCLPSVLECADQLQVLFYMSSMARLARKCFRCYMTTQAMTKTVFLENINVMPRPEPSAFWFNLLRCEDVSADRM